jgi:hypothetical protein
MEKEKQSKQQEQQKNTKNTLSQVTKELSWFGGLERIWSIECVLEWMLLLLYWMWISENLDRLNGGGWGIYSLQPLPSRWLSLLSTGAPDSPVVHQTGHYSLSGACHVITSLEFGVVDRWSPLSCSCTGQSGGMVHRTCPVRSDFAAWHLTSALCAFTVPAVDRWAHRLPLLCWLTGHVWCTPDSPVNYSGATLGKTREWLVRVVLGLGHQTLSDAHRTLSGAPLAAHSQHSAPNFVESPT